MAGIFLSKHSHQTTDMIKCAQKFRTFDFSGKKHKHPTMKTENMTNPNTFAGNSPSAPLRKPSDILPAPFRLPGVTARLGMLAAMLVVVGLGCSAFGQNLLTNGNFTIPGANFNCGSGGYVGSAGVTGWTNAGTTYNSSGYAVTGYTPNAGLWMESGDSGVYQISTHQIAAGDVFTLTWQGYNDYNNPTANANLVTAATPTAAYTALTTVSPQAVQLTGSTANNGSSWVSYTNTYTAASGDVGHYIGVKLYNSAPNSGAWGWFASISLTYVAPGAGLAIITQPISQTNVLSGDSVSFTAQVSSSHSPITYQWAFGAVGGPYTNLVNGGTISGATTNVLTISSVANTNAGGYVCHVSDTVSNLTTTEADLAFGNSSLTNLVNPGFETVNGGVPLGSHKVNNGYDNATYNSDGWNNAGATYTDTGLDYNGDGIAISHGGSALAYCQGGEGGAYQIIQYQMVANTTYTLAWWAAALYPSSGPGQTVSLLSAPAATAPYTNCTMLAAVTNSLTSSYVQYTLTYTATTNDAGKRLGIYFNEAVAGSGNWSEFDDFSLTSIAGVPATVPGGLTAVAGAGQATLNWNTGAGDTGYNLKRSTTSGSGYVTIAANYSGTNYVDTGLTAGTTYYYVVSGTNVLGESANSTQVSVTPLAVLTALWSGSANSEWDFVDANWTTNGVSALYVDGYKVVFDDTASQFSVDLSNNVAPGSLTFSNTANNYSIGSSGGFSIGGSGTLTKTGNGKLTLSSANTCTGTNLLNGGVLSLNNAQAIPTTATANISFNGGTLQFTANNTHDYSARIQNSSGAITIDPNGNTVTFAAALAANNTGGLTLTNSTGTGLLVLQGTNGYSGGTTINAGRLAVSPSVSGTLTTLGSGPVTNNASTLYFYANNGSDVDDYANNFVLNGGTLTSYDGDIHLGTGVGAAINVTAATTVSRQYGHGGTAKKLNFDGLLQGSAGLTLNGVSTAFNEGGGLLIGNAANTYSGTITVNSTSGNGMALIVGGNTALEYATINVQGNGSADVPYGLRFNPGVNAPVIGALVGNGKILLADLSSAPVSLTIGGGGAVTYSGVLSGSGAITYAGVGSLVLSGANSYSGGTTISSGLVNLNTTMTGGGPIAVADGASFAITVSSGTLTASSLTLGASGNVTNEFLGIYSTTTAPVTATNLTVNGVVTVNIAGSFSVIGQYPLIQYTSIGGSGHFSLGTVPPGVVATLGTNTGTSTIVLNVTATSPLVWTGSNSGIWDINGTLNWQINNTPSVYQDGGSVLFNDSSTVTSVSIAAPVNPGGVTITTTNGYTLSGSPIEGSGSLTLNGGGTLTLEGMANTYSGPTVLNGGTTIVDNGSNLGVGTITLNNATLEAVASFTLGNSQGLAVGPAAGSGVGTISVASGQTVVVDGSIVNNGGTGALILPGSGGAVLLGAGTYSGGTIVNSGSLTLGYYGTENTSSLGTGSVLVTNGASFNLGGAGGGASPANTYYISNAFTLDNATVLVYDGVQHLVGAVNVSSNGAALETEYQHKDLYFDGVVSGSGPLSVDDLIGPYGDGMTHFSNPSNTYSGILSINSPGYEDGGVVSVDNNTALANAIVNNNGYRADYGSGLVFGTGVTNAQIAGLQGASWGVISLPAGVKLVINGSSTNEYDGVLTNSGGLTLTGAGVENLTGDNTYTGNTTISTGTLMLSGSGSIDNSSISIASGATLDVSARGDQTLTLNGGQGLAGGGGVNGNLVASAGSTVSPGSSAAIGKLTVTNNISLNGAMFLKLNRTNSQTCDRLVSALGTVTYGGTLSVTNIGPALHVGDSFQLFPSAAVGFSSASLPSTDATGSTYTWNNNIATSGSIQVATVTSPLSTNAYLTSLVFSPSAGFAPAFTSNVLTGYSETNAYGDTPTVTVTNADPTATNMLIVNGVSLGILTNEVASVPLTLGVGSTNVVQLQVVSQDLSVTNLYVVDVTMQGSSFSTNNLLTYLAVNPPAEILSGFVSNTITYSVTNYLPNNPVTVTVTNADTTATNSLFFQGSYVSGLASTGATSSALTLTQGVANVVQVQVVSQSGVTNTYTVNVTLQPNQSVPRLTNSVSGSTLALSWPADHLGYRLLVQTNNLNKGVSSNTNDWGTVANSQSITATNITIIKTGVTNEYYRLVYP
jgi:autotransporter-associated beta strand protein